MDFPLRDVFDVPDLATTNDDIVNGFGFTIADGSGRWPRSPPSGSTIRWPGCRITPRPTPEHFQNHVLFTNYQFYVEEFEAYARACAGRSRKRLHSLRRPRQRRDHRPEAAHRPPRQAAADADLSPQARRTVRGSRWSTSASARPTPRPRPTISPCCGPHAWLMVGHCAGLRNSQTAGRFRAGPCLSARRQRAGRRSAGLGADPAAGRDPDRAGRGGGRGHRA